MFPRIIYVASHIEPVHTGGEQYNLHLINAAEKAGVEVVRVALTDSAAYNRFSDTPVLWRLCRAFIYLWLQLQIIRFRRETILLDAWFVPLSWPGVLWVRGRYIVMVHHLCSRLFDAGWRRNWEVFCETRMLSSAMRILTVSQSSRRQVEERLQGSVPVDVINTAFEPVEGISRGGGKVFRILYVGHITNAKGVVDLAKAVAGLAIDIDWCLDLVGRNSVEPDTTEKIRTTCREAG
ncbi:MAG: glycosyltransferase, partial [Mariprofundaceae bacterium]|nr:glycosyltransferase [Mariprofundaceae bacterium]